MSWIINSESSSLQLLTILRYEVSVWRLSVLAVEHFVPDREGKDNFLLLQMTLKRALTPMLPNLDAQLVPYSHSRAGQSVHRPATAPSASHPPPTPLDPPAQAPPNFLGDVTDTASDQCQSEASSQPQQLPLASELSLSSTDNSSFALEARSQGQQAADSSNQSRHDFASDILHQRDAVTLGDRLVDNMQQPVIDERQEPTNGLKGSRASSARQQSLLNQQQQHNGQLRDSSAGSVWPGRVSVDTAGSVRRTVITVAELQATVQPEGASAQRAFQDDRMTGRLTSSASPSASEQEGEPARLGSHAHLSRSQLGVFASQSDLQLQSNALQQRGSAAESHQQALPQQVAVTSLHVPDRALRDSPALNSARDRANSPLPEGKSHSPASQLIAVRRSQDTDAVLQSHPAAQEAALLSAVQDVQHASDDNATAAVQALQLQVCSTAALALQACLPQVCASVHVHVRLYTSVCSCPHACGPALCVRVNHCVLLHVQVSILAALLQSLVIKEVCWRTLLYSPVYSHRTRAVLYAIMLSLILCITTSSCSANIMDFSCAAPHIYCWCTKYAPCCRVMRI